MGLVSKVIGPEGQASFVNISNDLTLQGSDIHLATPLALNRVAEQLSEFIDEQLRIEAIAVPKGSEQSRWLAKGFYAYLYELESMCRARLVNDWIYSPAKSIAEEPLSLDAPPKLAQGFNSIQGKGRALSVVFDVYRGAEGAKVNNDLSRLKTLDGYEASFKRFIELVGDVPIDGLTTKHVMGFRDTLLQMPKNKTKKIRALSVKGQIAYAQENGIPLISPTTVKNALKHISTIFNHAVEAELITINPVQRVKKPGAAKVVEASEKERGRATR